MNQIAFPDPADLNPIDAGAKLDPATRSALGLYMTPVPIPRFMARLFKHFAREVQALDAGAGFGSLMTAIFDRIWNEKHKPRSLHLTCFEIAGILLGYLQKTLDDE